MRMSNVLVMFQADTEHTEQLALAVGVGAVEAGANIRLRRLAAPGAVELAHKGYGTLQAVDLLWANTVVIGLESPIPREEELGGLLSLLGKIVPAQMQGKQAWTFNPDVPLLGRTEALDLVESAFRNAGIAVLLNDSLGYRSGEDEITRMKEAGRSLAK